MVKSYEIALPAHIAQEEWRKLVRADQFVRELRDVSFDPLDAKRSRLRVSALRDGNTLAIDAVVQRFRSELARKRPS
jgi:hypothetical protein